jgi:hypothetical protein
MVSVLKKGATKKISKQLKKSFIKRNLPQALMQKYNGVLKLKVGPLGLQTKLRDEWERDFS